ncbi:MAG: hypothetical protein ABEH61_03185 [Haloarculaceae archaeon]
METLADLLVRGRDRDGPVFDAPGRRTPYTYREFCTNAWKAGNLLRHYGVRSGSRVGLVVGPKSPTPGDEPGVLGASADPLVALFGAGAVGATVDVSPEPPVDAGALIAPDAWLDRYEVAPGCSRLAYGGPPDAADVAHFERELWSENPTEPPDAVAATDTALATGATRFTHGDLLAGAESVRRSYDLGTGDVVVLDARLTAGGAVAAGVVAPLLAGATIRPPGPATDDDPAYVVGGDGTSAGGPPVVAPSEVIG